MTKRFCDISGRRRRATKPAVGWGLTVGIPPDRVAAHFFWHKCDAEAKAEQFHLRFPDVHYDVARVALVPLAAAKAAGLLEKDDASD